MSDEPSTPKRSTRRSVMQVAAGTGILSLIASAFLTYQWLRTERWVMGYDYLAWILGFVATGVVLLFVTRREWRDTGSGPRLLRVIVILVGFLALLYGMTIYRRLFLLRGWQ